MSPCPQIAELPSVAVFTNRQLQTLTNSFSSLFSQSLLQFDAGPLPTTFACWNSLVPCRAAEQDLGEEQEDDNVDEWVLFDMSTNGSGRKLAEDEQDDWECEADYTYNNNNNSTTTSSSSFFRGIANSFFKRCKRKPKTKDYFDNVPADGLRTTSADLFLFYSQTFSENDEAMKSVDTIMEEFFSPGGWSRCFDNIYAVEANIPKELDLYIPAAQEELYSWVNGPNRQYEAGFRIIQSGEWGDYDGFYLMEGDSVSCCSLCLCFDCNFDVSLYLVSNQLQSSLVPHTGPGEELLVGCHFRRDQCIQTVCCFGSVSCFFSSFID